MAGGHDARHRERFGSTAVLLAETYELGGDLERARRLVEQALAEFNDLLALDAGNARWRRGLGASTKELAEIDVHSGRADAALAGIDEALTLFGRMAADDPSNADIQQQIAHSLRVQAAALQAVGRLEEALAAAAESLRRMEAIAPGDPRDAALFRLDYEVRYARLLDRAGRQQEAAALRDAIQRTLGDTRHTDPRVIAPLAEVALALGDAATADRLVAQLLDAGCRHPAYADVLGLAADSP